MTKPEGLTPEIVDWINMARAVNPADKAIIKLLQEHGLIKSEAEARLKRDIYRLQPSDIEKVKNYAQHFGLHAKEQLIDEILELRRESLMAKLTRRSK
jgi:DNA-binding PadR family transcriptional regulator